jgi:hypothetical protein
MNKIVSIICTLVAAAFVAVFAMLGFQFITLKQTELKNEAGFQCAQSSRYQVTQKDGTVVWYPVEELYNKCIKEKGL